MRTKFFILALMIVFGAAVISACMTRVNYYRGKSNFGNLAPGVYEVVAPYPAKIYLQSPTEVVLYVNLPSDAESINWAIMSGEMDKDSFDTPIITYMDRRGYHYQLSFPYVEIRVGDILEKVSGNNVKDIVARPLK